MLRRIAWGAMLKRLAVPLVALLVLTACGSSGEPEGFDEQPVRISEELQNALDTDTEFLPVVERNFLEGCLLADTPRITSNDLAGSCQCAYTDIVAFYRDNFTGETPIAAEKAAFDAFKELDDALQSETGVIPANIQSILDGCSN